MNESDIKPQCVFALDCGIEKYVQNGMRRAPLYTTKSLAKHIQKN